MKTAPSSVAVVGGNCALPKSRKRATEAYQQDFSLELRDDVRKWINRFLSFDEQHDQFWLAVRDLETEWVHLPFVNDAVWRVLNEERLDAFRRGRLGFYLIATWNMSCLVATEKKYPALLDLTAEHMLLEFLGVSNGDGAALTKASFDERFGAINQNRVANLELSISQLGLERLGVQERFMHVGNRVFAAIEPVKPRETLEAIWIVIAAQIDWANQCSTPVRLRKTQPTLSDPFPSIMDTGQQKDMNLL
jgi:hypothetical protein